MAELGQPSSRQFNYHVVFPLHLLPMTARLEIAKYFDGDFSRFNTLAFYLGFDDLDFVKSIWTRGFQGIQNSGTLKLLDEFQQRHGTVQKLYWALCQMKHYAANVILQYNSYIQEAYLQWFQSRNGTFHGQQNSCSCNSCTQRNFSPQNYDETQSRQRNLQYDRQLVPEPQPPGSSYPQGHPNIHGIHQQSSPVNHFENGERNQPIDTSVNQRARSPQGGRRSRCNCENCRLASDPNETQLLTYYSADKQEDCLIEHMSNVGLSQRLHNSEGSNGVSGTNTHLKTNKLGKTISDTQLKKDKLCANSSKWNHFIGDMPETCSVCKKYINGSETRRYTWDGSQDLPHKPQLRDSSSDGSLNAPPAPVEKIYDRLNNLHSVDMIETPGNLEITQRQNIPNSHSANYSQTNYSSVSKSASNKSNKFDSDKTNDSRESSSTIQPDNGEHQPTQQPSLRSYQQTPSRPPLPPTPPPQEVENKPIVFITYSTQSNLHLEEIKELIRRLQQAGVRVKIDMDPACFNELGLNRNEWLDRSVYNADFILICVSPMYYLDVCTSQNVNSASPRISQLNARYIYDRLRTEYIHNQSQNRRMIPVLFPRSGANYIEHLPPIMQATLVYTFPDQIHKIIGRILGNDSTLPYV